MKSLTIYSVKDIFFHIVMLIVFSVSVTFLFFMPGSDVDRNASTLAAIFWPYFGGAGLVLAIIGFGGAIGQGIRVVIILMGDKDLNKAPIPKEIANLVVFSIYAPIGVALLYFYTYQ